MSKGKLTAEQLDWLKEYYATTQNAQIMGRLDISKETLRRYKAMLGLTKCKAYISYIYRLNYYKHTHTNLHKFKRGEAVRDKMSQERRAEMDAKRAESWKNTYNKDRRRFMFGLPQRTGFVFTNQSRSKIDYRRRLRRNGYIEDTTDHNVYYYVSDDKRHKRMERNAVKHNVKIYHISSKPAFER